MDTSRFQDTAYGPLLPLVQKMLVDQGRNGMPVEVATRAIREALEAPRPKSRYALPRRPLTGWLIPRLLPDRMLDRMMARRMGITRRPAEAKGDE
jgi:hypothetical protein